MRIVPACLSRPDPTTGPPPIKTGELIMDSCAEDALEPAIQPRDGIPGARVTVIAGIRPASRGRKRRRTAARTRKRPFSGGPVSALSPIPAPAGAPNKRTG